MAPLKKAAGINLCEGSIADSGAGRFRVSVSQH